MRPLPLKWRMSLLVAGLLAAAVAATCGVAYVEMREALQASIDETLTSVAGGLMPELDEHTQPEALQEAIRAFVLRAGFLQSIEYRVWADGAAGDLAASRLGGDAGSDWRRALANVPQPKPRRVAAFDLGSRDRAVWVRQPTRAGDTNVVLSGSRRYLNREMREFFRTLFLLGAAVVTGGAILGTLSVLWTARTVAQTAARLRAITHRDLGREPLDRSQTPRELRPFIDSVAEMLARLNRALQQQREFTADASHDLRTPLAAAKSTLQAIRTRARSAAEYEQAIDETLEDLGRMERLVKQLLALARLDEAEPEPEATRVPLDALLAHVASRFAARAVANGGRILFEPAAPTEVLGVEEQLVQLFDNLVENALVHGPRGGTVRLDLSHEGDGHCAVCVHDEGGSIPAEALPRLFDRFYRADASRSSAGGGSGLGLAIAREVARRHGGDIEAVSSPAAGTRFTVRLPRV